MVFSAFALSIELFLLTIYYYLTHEPQILDGEVYQINRLTTKVIIAGLICQIPLVYKFLKE